MEEDELNSSFKERDCFGYLFQCIILLSPFSLPDQIFPLLRGVVNQLVCPHLFFKLDKLNEMYQMDVISSEKRTKSIVSCEPSRLSHSQIGKLMSPIYLVFCVNIFT